MNRLWSHNRNRWNELEAEVPGVDGPRRGDHQRRQPARLGINEVLVAEMEVVHSAFSAVKVHCRYFSRLSRRRFNRRRLTVSKVVYSQPSMVQYTRQVHKVVSFTVHII